MYILFARPQIKHIKDITNIRVQGFAVLITVGVSALALAWLLEPAAAAWGFKLVRAPHNRDSLACGGP